MIMTLLKPPPGDGDTPKESFSESLSVITGQFYLWSKGKKTPLQKQIYFKELMVSTGSPVYSKMVSKATPFVSIVFAICSIPFSNPTSSPSCWRRQLSYTLALGVIVLVQLGNSINKF